MYITGFRENYTNYNIYKKIPVWRFIVIAEFHSKSDAPSDASGEWVKAKI